MHHRRVSDAGILSEAESAFVRDARTAVLATVSADGSPRLVPICFVLYRRLLYTPLDEKPKRVRDPHELERVRDIVRDPRVGLLIDRWSEDWSRLGWLRLRGRAELIEPVASGAAADEHSRAVIALRAKYPQYADHRLEALPIIRVRVEGVRSWGDLSGGETDQRSR